MEGHTDLLVVFDNSSKSFYRSPLEDSVHQSERENSGLKQFVSGVW